MPTALDNLIHKHSKALILVFSTLVVVATLPVFLAGPPMAPKQPTRTIPKEKVVGDDPAGEPADWTEAQLKDWLANVSILFYSSRFCWKLSLVFFC